MTISYTIRTIRFRCLLAAGNSREDDRADRIVGMAEGGVGSLEQDVLLPSRPLERIDQLLGRHG
ncbi:hypothetical protein [Streptosporangium roseum]|uniref:hypothetical protein n=1 Tax=Streptosporangium roseum TaxID=2001 RepID=UPI00068D24AB|nr:hypothetical protein [Streptosporangium roseum]